MLITAVSGDNSMVDMLAGIDDKADHLDWIDKVGNNGLSPLSHDHADVYPKARKYMLHAPVLTCIPESGKVSVVPLNPLPTGSDWEYIDMQGFLNELGDDGDNINSIYHCDVVPLEQKPIEFYQNQNRFKAPMFSDLDFHAVPIEIQPTLCIVNWLRVRGLHVLVSDSRDRIEKCVDNCLHLEKEITSPPLRPIAGLHDGLRKIISRQAGNEYDTPSRNYFFIAANLKLITDDGIDEYLGDIRMNCPSIRERVGRLFEGGHYDPKTITCRNDVETKSDGTPCIMFPYKCMSSKSSVMYAITAIFEDATNGRYRVDESNCSCKESTFVRINLVFCINAMSNEFRSSSFTGAV